MLFKSSFEDSKDIIVQNDQTPFSFFSWDLGLFDSFFLPIQAQRLVPGFGLLTVQSLDRIPN